MLLAIDTSAGTGVAVVDRDRGVLAERRTVDTRSHAEVIGDLIVACLEESGTAVAALSGVAVGMGPGPFTGLRVGIAAAQAFALGAAKPVVRVVSHDAVAFEYYAAGGAGTLLVTTDARRRERYWSSYHGADEAGIPLRVGGPEIARPDAVERAAGETAAAGPGPAFTAAAPPAAAPSATRHRIDAEEVSAASLGLLAERIYEHGRPFAAAEPLYLRSPDVTLAAAPKRVTA
jgi:tRNA threonylcarbamoyl adenosine modification protein YeaZ